MVTIQIHAAIADDGTLTVSKVPLPAGTQVELTIRAPSMDSAGEVTYPLRGKPVTYVDPFEPATLESDWESLQ